MPSFLGHRNLHKEPSVKRWLASEGEKARKQQSLLVRLSSDMDSVQFSEQFIATSRNECGVNVSPRNFNSLHKNTGISYQFRTGIPLNSSTWHFTPRPAYQPGAKSDRKKSGWLQPVVFTITYPHTLVQERWHANTVNDATWAFLGIN